MQTELAQIISLTSYGNEFLRNGNCAENYFPDNSVFQSCKNVDFRNLSKSPTSDLQETIIANNPQVRAIDNREHNQRTKTKWR